MTGTSYNTTVLELIFACSTTNTSFHPHPRPDKRGKVFPLHCPSASQSPLIAMLGKSDLATAKGLGIPARLLEPTLTC